LRIVALRMSANLSVAAERLGIAPVSLARWLDRRPRPWTRKGSREERPSRDGRAHATTRGHDRRTGFDRRRLGER
jgi:hypothetical protein